MDEDWARHSETDFQVSLDGLKPVSLRLCRTCEWSAMEQKDRVCRFNPPQVTFMGMPSQQMVPGPTGPRPVTGIEIRNFCGFPVVRDDQWCGQWKRKGNGAG